MDILMFILFAIIGSMVGIATGLMPGFHVNNVALIALYLYSLGLDPLLLSSLIVGNLISHTFLDFIPSTFLGAPEEDTAVSVLPMHRLLLEGRGYHAVYLSAVGSIFAVFFSLPLILLFQVLMSIIGYETFSHVVPYILVSIILYMFYLESRKSLVKMLFAIYVFILSGVFGLVVLSLPQNLNIVPVDMGYSLLFPVFAGLFGFPTLLMSRNARIPRQDLGNPPVEKSHLKASFYGTLSGSLVGFLPGVTSGIASVISRAMYRDEDTENFIVSLGSVNTANALFNLAALFVILHPRSQAISAVGEMIPASPWISLLNPPDIFLLLLLSAAISSLIAFFLTLFFGKLFARGFGNSGPWYRFLVFSVVILVSSLILVFTGPLGLIVAAIATMLGFIPPKIGIMRVHMMGVIILPVLLFYIA